MSPKAKNDYSGMVRALALLGAAVAAHFGLADVTASLIAVAGAADTYKGLLRF